MDQQIDSGLAALTLVALFHQIPVNLENLKNEFIPQVLEAGKPSSFGDQEILLAAKSLGLKGGLVRLESGDFDERALPVICKSKDGAYFVIAAKKVADDGPCAIAGDA